MRGNALVLRARWLFHHGICQQPSKSRQLTAERTKQTGGFSGMTVCGGSQNARHPSCSKQCQQCGSGKNQVLVDHAQHPPSMSAMSISTSLKKMAVNEKTVGAASR